MQILKKEIREKIKKAGLELFATNGYSNTSLEMIAKRSNISTANIYKYFKNKLELLSELITPVYDELKKLVENVYNFYADPQNKEIDINKRFYYTTELLLKIALKNKLEVLILINGCKNTPFENLKYEFIDILKQNLLLYINDIKNKSNYELKEYDKIIIDISYKNILYGVYDILKNFDKEEDIINAIKNLYKKHFFGIKGLFDLEI